MIELPSIDIENPYQHSITIRVNGESITIGGGCASLIPQRAALSIEQEGFPYKATLRFDNETRVVEGHCALSPESIGRPEGKDVSIET